MDLFINPINGNVGIGTTNPNQKIDINGFLKTRVPSYKFLGAQAGALTIADSQLLANRTYYRLKFQTQLQNDETLFDTVNKNLKAPMNGLYFVSFSVPFSSGATGGIYYVYILKNSNLGDSTTSAASIYGFTVANAMLGVVSYNTVVCTTIVPLNKNDIIDAYVMYEDPATGGAYLRRGHLTTFDWSNPILTAYMISAS